ncbi:MAG: hypothetical protein AB7V39_16220 [Nitrospiraceae bacterium]
MTTGVRKELKGNQSNNPLVNLTDNIGGKFVGTILTAGREVKTSLGGVKYAYDFAVVDGDVDFVMKSDKKDAEGKFIYNTVDVKEGDRVTILATVPLHGKLVEAELGTTVEIEYMGKKKSKKGNMFHDFRVFSV